MNLPRIRSFMIPVTDTFHSYRKVITCMPMNIENVVIVDEASFLKKRDKLVADGLNAFHVITDFDYTLTKGILETGEVGWSTHGVVESCEHFSEDFRKQCKSLFDTYYPVEISHTLTKEEKIPKMIEWYTAAHEALMKERMTRAQLEKAVFNSHVSLREGAQGFLETLQANKIPTLVFSAGIATVIEMLLQEKFKVETNDEYLHIIGNRYLFDDEGSHVGFSEPMIHTFNKNESQTRGHPYEKQVSERKNVLLLGDNTGDTHMADGMTHETVLKVGFLNHKVEQRLPQYKQLFDVIITNDDSFDFVMKEIIGKLVP